MSSLGPFAVGNRRDAHPLLPMHRSSTAVRSEECVEPGVAAIHLFAGASIGGRCIPVRGIVPAASRSSSAAGDSALRLPPGPLPPCGSPFSPCAGVQADVLRRDLVAKRPRPPSRRAASRVSRSSARAPRSGTRVSRPPDPRSPPLPPPIAGGHSPRRPGAKRPPLHRLPGGSVRASAQASKNQHRPWQFVPLLGDDIESIGDRNQLLSRSIHRIRMLAWGQRVSRNPSRRSIVSFDCLLRLSPSTVSLNCLIQPS